MLQQLDQSHSISNGLPYSQVHVWGVADGGMSSRLSVHLTCGGKARGQSDAGAAVVRQKPEGPAGPPTRVTRAAFQGPAAEQASRPAPAATAETAARPHAGPPPGPQMQAQPPIIAAATMSGESAADDTGVADGLLDWPLPLGDSLLGSDQQTPHGDIRCATYEGMQAHQPSSTTARAPALQQEAAETL